MPDRCARCGIRWKQDGDLCRGCANKTGQTRTTQERDRARLARMTAKVQALIPVQEPHAPRTRVINGVEYEITFDGS